MSSLAVASSICGVNRIERGSPERRRKGDLDLLGGRSMLVGDIARRQRTGAKFGQLLADRPPRAGSSSGRQARSQATTRASGRATISISTLAISKAFARSAI